MTALSAQPVSSGTPQASGPSRAAQRAVHALLDAHLDFSPDEMADLVKKAGVGQVQAKVADTEDVRRGYGHDTMYFITRWNVYINGKQIGYITRSPASPLSFYGYSTVEKRALKGTVFTRIRDCIQWLLQWDVGHAAAPGLAAKATVEEGLEADDFVKSFDRDRGLLRRLRPRGAPKVASKEEAKARATADLDSIMNGVVQVYHMMSNESGDTVEVVAPEDHPFKVRVIGGDAERVNDNYVDPYWDVEVIEPHPSLPEGHGKYYWMDGQSYEFPVRVRESEEDEIPLEDVVKGGSTPVLKKGDDGRDVLYIPHMAGITPQQWEKISGIMRGKGYDSRGATDASRAVQQMLHRAMLNGRESRVLRHDDWVDTIAKVVGLKASSQKHSPKDRAATARKVFARAIREWGLTDNPGLAGYILPNGTMLDLSGGSGTRAYDHRQVGSFLEPSEHGRGATDCMHEFMDLGAIRWMPEGPGMDIRTPPTKQQYARIALLKEEIRDNLYLDVYSPNHGKAAREYGPRVPGQRVITDIQTFYKTGQLGYMSQVQQFHGMGESIVAMLLGEADDMLQDMGKVALNHIPSIAYRTWKTVYDKCVSAQDGEADEKAWEAVLNKLVPQSYAYMTDAAASYLAIRGFDAQDELDPEEAWDEARAHTDGLLPLSPEAMRAIESLWRSVYVKRTMHTPMAESDDQPDLPFDEPPVDISGITPEEIAMDSGVIEHYKQIDGDFGDAWLYGGTFYSAYVAKTGKRWDSIYHVDGLEREGFSDYDGSDKKVQARLMQDEEWKAKYEAKRQELLQQYLIDQSDDYEPTTNPEKIAWCEREAQRDAASEVGDALAEIMNAERKIPVYRTNDEDPYQGVSQEQIKSDLDYVGLEYEHFEKMPAFARVCLYGDTHGWQEIDHQPIEMTKAELEDRLKTSL